MSIPLQELRTPKTISNDNNNLPFITTYNLNNPNVYEMIDKSVECLKRNKVDDFENLRLIKSGEAPDLKKILTKAEFSQKQVGVYKCPDKRCAFCASLLLGNLYPFKNVDKTHNLNAYLFCDSSNLLYIIICPHVVKNTPMKLELVKPNSETVTEFIDNISGNLSIKTSR